ncbi:hypothetical protein LX97_01220 [Nonlabens dokdonensis]|jgi:hypothetical protein|uniref:Uncharacterized protein n=2 Tax=Nonlabens dokdonensis TaxID=328515 RepID=L7W4L9_NONDD|nr:hypothetical protein [Nonlabens dokdonensis]AGC76560.1 hypothetical protein DDD_1433 [Nonlabens dokdonensis DSW-6]PZX44210.1 hypothetical protein LX97_01220 [Nonlabens dokdonensis]
MKYIIQILVIFFVSFCTRTEDEKATCYSFLNGTNKEVQLELYNYNGNRITIEIGTYLSSGPGLLVNKCKESLDVPGPVSVYRFDSIVVKFDNTKKLTFLGRLSQDVPDPLFFEDSYQRDGNSLNFSYTFTEEDYNNAVPY